MAHFLFNDRGGDPSRSTQMLRSGWWPVDAAEPHGRSLTSGDLVLVYMAAPLRILVGRAALASAVQDQRPPEDSAGAVGMGPGVALIDIEVWDPPVGMQEVLARIDRSAGARADFDTGVVRITEDEYAIAVTVAAERTSG